MAQKRITITSKDIKAGELVDSTWIDVFITFIGTEIAGRCFDDLKTIASGLVQLQITTDSIASITLLVTDDGDFSHVTVDGLFYLGF